MERQLRYNVGQLPVAYRTEPEGRWVWDQPLPLGLPRGAHARARCSCLDVHSHASLSCFLPSPVLLPCPPLHCRYLYVLDGALTTYTADEGGLDGGRAPVPPCIVAIAPGKTQARAASAVCCCCKAARLPLPLAAAARLPPRELTVVESPLAPLPLPAGGPGD